MQYPGNPELSAQAQERVLTTFKQAVQKLHAGGREEAMIALEFVLRLDPQFHPARQLHDQLTSGAQEIDLSSIVGQLQETTDTKIDQLLVDAVDDFNERRFHKAREKVDQVLRELPGHKEARNLLTQIEGSLKTEAQVGQYLVQAREALDRGEPEEAANFVMMAQALDPHHPGIASLLKSLEEAGAFVQQEPLQPAAPTEEPPGQYETRDFGEAPPAEGGFDGIFGGEDDSGPGWSFDEPAAPPAEGPAGAEESFTEGGDAFVEGSGVDDLFDVGEEPSFEAPPEVPAGEGDGRIQQLLIQGKSAFEEGDYQGAIDVWSRIFLSDPENAEAKRLIEDARQRKEDLDRQIDHLLYEAEEAITSGRSEDARRLLGQVLEFQPGNIHALDLMERLERGSRVAEAGTPESEGEEPASILEDLDVDLFDEETPAPAPPAEEAAEVPSLDLEGLALEVEEGAIELPEARRKGKFSVRTMALAVIGLLVVVLGAWFGARMFTGHRQEKAQRAMERTLREAERLYKHGQAREAVRLLQSLEVTGPDQIRVSRRLARYKKALVPPTPTPVPKESLDAQKAFEEGRLVEAYSHVQAGLGAHPSDPGLQDLRERILEQQPSIGPLVKALSDNDYQTALGICRTLLEKDPDNAEYQELLKRSLFDLAITELRKYNLTEADGHLAELDSLQPGDEEVQRIREFIARYKTRPADMQLKIFIASLKLR